MGALATAYVGKGLSVIVDLVIILDALSLSIAIMITAARIIFALARDGLLPRAAAITSRYDTPVVGNLVIVVWSAALLVWAGVTHSGKTVQLPDPIRGVQHHLHSGQLSGRADLRVPCGVCAQAAVG
jgi:amino acid transporter